jgi:D-inositol-3-phosphate glycosyltransferase
MFSLHSSPIAGLGSRNNGGMSVVITELTRELGRLGVEVDVFTAQPLPAGSSVVRLSPRVRLIHLPGAGGANGAGVALHAALPRLLESLQAWCAAEEVRYDLLHTHYWLSGVLGMTAQERWGIPHLTMFHSLGAVKNAVAGSEREPPLRLAREQELAQRCQLVVAPTEREKSNLLMHCGVSRERVRVIPCGVDLGHFRPLERSAARGRIGWDPEEPILLYVGRFAPVKGVDLLPAVLVRVRTPQVRLLVVGGDGGAAESAAPLRREAARLGLEERITFLGPVEHAALPSYYAAADLVVVPSRYESFGLVGLEALACGTPVVGTRVGALPDLVRSPTDGRVVEVDSPSTLAASIDEVLRQGPLSPREADRLHQGVEPFAWRRVAEATFGEYLSLLQTKGRKITGSKGESLCA